MAKALSISSSDSIHGQLTRDFSPRFPKGLFLRRIVWFLVVIGTLQIGRALHWHRHWAQKHANCFRGEAAGLSWSIPETPVRPCPSSHNNHTALFVSPHDICIVSLTDGMPNPKAATLWNVPLWPSYTKCRNFDTVGPRIRANQAAYAARHGYQYTMMEKTLDTK